MCLYCLMWQRVSCARAGSSGFPRDLACVGVTQDANGMSCHLGIIKKSKLLGYLVHHEHTAKPELVLYNEEKA